MENEELKKAGKERYEIENPRERFFRWRDNILNFLTYFLTFMLGFIIGGALK